jgi:quercetin dioxygenase-like cupin family protein
MNEEIIVRRGNTLVRRLRLAPGEALAWHRDPFHRVTVVLSGTAISIEYRDGGASQHIPVVPGQVDWDEPTDRIHRGINSGSEPYEEVTIFFLDDPQAIHQPAAE